MHDERINAARHRPVGMPHVRPVSGKEIRRLQGAGFSPKRVYCTSNKNDYCERPSSRLHPSLAVDFGAAGLGFAANLPWSVNEIKKP